MDRGISARLTRGHGDRRRDALLRHWRTAALVVAALILVYCWWNWAGWRQQAWIASGFGARIACSCRLVEGRPMDSCRRDFARLKGMGLVRLSDRADGKGVDAAVPLLASRSARIVPGFGCVIDP